MPGLIAACFRALDKHDRPSSGNCAAHSLQHRSFRTFNIDFDELRIAEISCVNEFIDGHGSNRNFGS